MLSTFDALSLISNPVFYLLFALLRRADPGVFAFWRALQG